MARWCGQYLLLKFENIEPLGVLFAQLLAEIVARRRSF
jgi:hypothetical protein